MIPLLCDLTQYSCLEGAVFRHSITELAKIPSFHCYVISRNTLASKELFLDIRSLHWPKLNNSIAMWSHAIFLPRRSSFWHSRLVNSAIFNNSIAMWFHAIFLRRGSSFWTVDQWIGHRWIIPLLCDRTECSCVEGAVLAQSISELAKFQ